MSSPRRPAGSVVPGLARTGLVLALAAGVVAGCRPETTPDDAGLPSADAGCVGPPECGARRCGVDACGRSCGACDAGQICDPDQARCVDGCVPETPQAFCARVASAGKVCGSVTDVERCGGSARTEDCGACAPGERCTPANACERACSPETAAAFCGRMRILGRVCGVVSDADPCTGQPRSEDCGPCAAGLACTALANCASTCVPESTGSFCARLGRQCGEAEGIDSCGVARRSLCGTCPTGTCQPDGTCCAYETPGAFCDRMAAAGRPCGVVSGSSCGTSRQEDCGVTRCPTDGGPPSGCDLSSNTCARCITETPAQFCARMGAAGAECGLVTGVDACSQLIRTVDCGDSACSAGSACVGNSCVIGGTCASPLQLQPDPVDPGHFTAAGNTASGASSLASACGLTTGGPELIYRVDPVNVVDVDGGTLQSFVATVRAPPGAASTPVLSVRSSCAQASGNVCQVGASLASVRLNGVTPAARYVVVDSTAAAASLPFALDVRVSPAYPAAANDDCATAINLGTPAGPGWTSPDPKVSTISVFGATLGANDDGAGTCGASGAGKHSGADVVYRFTIPAGAQYAAALSVSPTDVDFIPAVYLRTGACNGGEVACASATPTTAATVNVPSLGPGTYFFHVDGVAGTGGPFTAVLTLTAP